MFEYLKGRFRTPDEEASVEGALRRIRDVLGDKIQSPTSARVVGSFLVNVAHGDDGIREQISQTFERLEAEEDRPPTFRAARAMVELSYVRISAVDIAAFSALEGKPARDPVLGVYRAYLQAMENLTTSPDELHTRRQERMVAYAEAAEKPHKFAPLWHVGATFAQLCGSERDAAVSSPAWIVFGFCLKEGADLLSQIEIS
jgi:hypothetical protein